MEAKYTPCFFNVNKCDKYGNAKPSEVMKILADISDEQLREFIEIRPELKRSDAGFLMMRFGLRFASPVKVNTHALASTMPTKSSTLSCTRDYEILSKEGDLLVFASSVWVYVDKKEKKSIRVPASYDEFYGTLSHHEDVLMRISAESNYEEESPLPLLFDDFDENEHVNHVRYFSFPYSTALLDFDHYRMANLAINFKDGIRYGDEARIYNHVSQNEEDGSNLTVLSQKIASNGRSAAFLKSQWVKR